jgi:hypothetical protein
MVLGTLSAMQLEQQIQQLAEQRQHVAVQLEQLEGLEGGKDQIGVSDLKQQLQVRSYPAILCPARGCAIPFLQVPVLSA